MDLEVRVDSWVIKISNSLVLNCTNILYSFLSFVSLYDR